jgi:hypothetical protein
MTYQLIYLIGPDAGYLTLQPETGRWVSRESVGINGAGHPIYPAVREFELRWGFMSPTEFKEIQDFYALFSSGAYVVASLPQYGASTYTFHNYSGATLREPEVGEFFEGYYSDVLLIILGVVA